MPHVLRSIHDMDKDEAALGMRTGFDSDISRQFAQTSNRIHRLFAQTHLLLTRVLDP